MMHHEQLVVAAVFLSLLQASKSACQCFSKDSMARWSGMSDDGLFVEDVNPKKLLNCNGDVDSDMAAGCNNVEMQSELL